MGLFSKLFSKPGEQVKEAKDFSEGDLFYTHSEEQYRLYKVLVVENVNDVWHVLAYKPVSQLPDQKAISALNVAVYHLPMSTSAFANPHFFAAGNVSADDLVGYHEYLRQTQSPDYYVSIAQSYYLSALRFTDEKKHEQAINAYSKAIDLVPAFFEALDNRAFCKMDLGRWSDAIEDFRASLQVQPNSLLAEFSIGECYFRLEDYVNAKAQFEKAAVIDPEHAAPKEFLQKVNALLR